MTVLPADPTAEPTSQRLSLLPGEHWWGGAVADGRLMPFGTAAHRRNLGTSAGGIENSAGGGNQSAPLLVSSAGRYFWSELPFTFTFDGTSVLEMTAAT